MESMFALLNNTSHILTFVAVSCITVILFKLLKLCLPILIKQNRTRHHVQDLCGLILGAIFIIFVLTLFRNQIKEFAVPFSLIGAGITVALQNVIISLTGRVVIIGTGIYRLGDRVQIGDMQGDVIKIGFLRTSLMEIGSWVKADQFSGRIVHIANSAIFKEDIINYSASFPFVWDEISIPIKYGSSQNNARSILLNIAKIETSIYQAKALEEWKKMMQTYLVEEISFAPIVAMIANDNWMEFHLRYIVPFNLRRVTKDKLYTQIIDTIVQDSDSVSLGSTTLEISSFPDLKIKKDE